MREKEAINNVARVRENVVIFADGSCLIVYDRVAKQELLSFWYESQVRSIKPILEPSEEMLSRMPISIQEKAMLAKARREQAP